MPTTLTCYGGVDEIGGNKILLEDGDRRVFFDFGRSFARYRKFFDGVFLSERPQRGLLDLLALEVIPPLPGLLRQDLIPAVDPAGLRKTLDRVQLPPAAVKAFWATWQARFPGAFRDLRRGRRRPVDAILISHAHLDHIGDMAYVSPDVPAYGTRLTAFICKALADMSQAPNGVASVRLRSLSSDGYLQADSGRREPLARPWRFIDGAPAGKAQADPLHDAASFAAGLLPLARPALKVESWPVDHSLFGAVGYAVETEAGWVAYTGDIRFSGINGGQTRAFAERLAALRPAALVCEGTRLGGSGRVIEAQVHDNCLKAVQAAAGRLVLADFSPRNVERLLAFADIAGRTDRCLLIQPRDAYLLRAMHLADPDLIGDVLALPHVKLYADPKLRPAGWEQSIRARCDSVGPVRVRQDPADYILAFSLGDLADLLDLDFLSGGQTAGVYIFSNSQAYDDEQQIDMVRLWRWIQRLGLEAVGLRPRLNARGEVVAVTTSPGYHASGHAGGDELADFVRQVRPRRLIPVHTTSPGKWVEMLAGAGITVTRPRYGQALPID
jgi:ribonuclease J